MSDNTTRVAILHKKYYQGINTGEIAGYPADIAKKLVKAGIGDYHNKADKKTAKADEKKKKVPEAKVMLNIDELMEAPIEAIKAELDIKVSSGNFLYPAQYLSDALDFESLNKGREGMMDYLLQIMEDRDESKA